MTFRLGYPQSGSAPTIVTQTFHFVPWEPWHETLCRILARPTKSVTPKFRINATPDGYNHGISSPRWGFGETEPLPPEEMGLVQLSNRMLIPPDGLTFEKGQWGEVFGSAWMALPIRNNIQRAVEAIHRSWTPNQEYIPAPSSGALVKLDDALIVNPPKGFAAGYVPIVIRQELNN